ncbi:MAG: hypothetical protein EA401_01465 [Planctomycetota bacterium]|nr:MAG: hypothetical protein EA401_01465 [Planctomycetota bacterium]
MMHWMRRCLSGPMNNRRKADQAASEETERAVPAVPAHPDDDETICYCIGVTRGQLRAAFHQRQCRDLNAVVRATGAMGGCMTCRYDIEEVLREERERFPQASPHHKPKETMPQSGSKEE